MNECVKPLNLLILCPDELRADCVGFMGNPDLKTPNLDALAAQSVVFPRHMASFPKCVPARITMITGRYSHADGVRTIFQRLPEGTPNLLTRLRSAGYETAFFGKNHCWSVPDRKAGFDHSSKHGYYGAMMEGVPAIRRSEPSGDGPQPPSLPDGYDYIGCHTRHAGDEVFTRQACHFLREGRDPNRPFFLQVNLESPHPVYGVEEPWYSLYDREKIRAWPHQLPARAPAATARQREIRTSTEVDEQALREIQAVYYGMIAKVDAQIGEIIDALKASGEWENTVILFLSDHGDYAGQYGLVEKWDTCLNDCIVHTPFTLKAPGLPPGTRVDSMSDHSQICATLLDLLGLPPLEGMHGRSLLPVIAGDETIEFAFSEGGHGPFMRAAFRADRSSPARVENPDLPLDAKQKLYQRYPETMARAVMVRSRHSKLIIREDGDNEFYDLTEDPWELSNRWGESAVAAESARLMGALAEWQLRTSWEGPHEEFFGA
jgi:choline-sulfatase